MNEYRVNLDVFAGPLDLLLYLVRKEEVDIYNIPISRITEQYINYIQIMQSLDIDLAGDFLVMAATLMEIKSAMLLPSTEPQEGEEGSSDDPRTELVRQLLEYKRIKDAANLLADAAETRQLRFTRPDNILAAIKSNNEPELDLDQVSIWTLLEAFDSIMKSVGQLSSYSHITDDTPIDLYQIELLHRLQTEGPMPFEQLFTGPKNRMAMIGVFLAMLELIRNQLVRAEQTENKGPIYLKPLSEKPAEQAVQEAIFSRQSQEIQNDRIPDNETEIDQDINQPENLPQELQLDQHDFFDEDDVLKQQIDSIVLPFDNDQPPRQPRIPIQEIKSSSDTSNTNLEVKEFDKKEKIDKTI